MNWLLNAGHLPEDDEEDEEDEDGAEDEEGKEDEDEGQHSPTFENKS